MFYFIIIPAMTGKTTKKILLLLNNLNFHLNFAVIGQKADNLVSGSIHGLITTYHSDLMPIRFSKHSELPY